MSDWNIDPEDYHKAKQALSAKERKGELLSDSERAMQRILSAISDPRRFSELTKVEREALVGAPVVANLDGETIDGFYMGLDDDGDHYILRKGMFGRLGPKSVKPDEITLGNPNTPRAYIPGYTYEPGEAPDNAQGWLAEDSEYGTAIVLTSEPDEDDEYWVFLSDWNSHCHRHADELTNWRPLP